MNAKNVIKVVKSFKLSFDVLGYAVVDGKLTTDRNIYRKLLRSGKQEPLRMPSNNRTFQVNRFYKSFFDLKVTVLTPRCDYKAVIYYLLTGNHRADFYKQTKQVGDRLQKLGKFEMFILPDGKLLKDTHNNKDFYFSNKDGKIYRLSNGKAILYKVR